MQTNYELTIIYANGNVTYVQSGDATEKEALQNATKFIHDDIIAIFPYKLSTECTDKIQRTFKQFAGGQI